MAYLGSFPLLGEGRIFRTSAEMQVQLLGPSYNGAVAPDAAGAVGGSGLTVLRTRPEYQHVAAVQWFSGGTASGNLEHYGYGVVGLVQPTPAGAIPNSGVRSYWGAVDAYLAGNFADAVGGTAYVQFDFSTGTFTVNLDLALVCFMGCLYPTAPYSSVAPSHARGAATFTGGLQTSATGGQGTFIGRFAGPDARELLIEFRTPFFDPDRQIWTEVSGIAVAKVP